MSAYKTITVTDENSVVTITLNRPAAANAMNLLMTRELADIAGRCAASSSKAVVLTGSGRFFCAGGDLGDFAAAADRGANIRVIADTLHQAISHFSRMGAVFIVAVNGAAAGAGLSVAASADIVLAAESATFTMAYTRVGLSPDGSASYFLPRVIGLRRTQELMLTNRTVPAVQAQHWGLVTEVIPDGDLATRAAVLAAQFASGSRGSAAAVKKLLMASFGNDVEAQMNLEAALIAENAASTDGHEGVDAFLAKRRAQFS